MDFEFITYAKRGHLAVVTLNRPKRMNALHPPAHAELTRAWADYMADDDLWVAILTGAGDRAFSAGSDLKYRVADADEKALRKPEAPGRHILDRCNKPIIAAVNGYAVGGGLELALRCDIIIAADHAQFGLPESRRGLLADAGGAIKLPRRIPYHLAMGLVLTGKFISAETAHQYGLVNEVVPMNDLMATAESWANEIIECSPLALQAAKQVITQTLDLPNDVAARQIESMSAVRRLRESEDYAEGPLAFSEKRKPNWKGR